jgi:TonB family protein
MWWVSGFMDKQVMMHLGNQMILAFLWFGWGTLVFPAISLAGDPPDISESIEILEVIEVTGTTVTTTARTLSFPLPTFSHTGPFPSSYQLTPPDLHVVIRPERVIPRILIDQTGKARGRFTRVKLLKTERPLYPRMAREQGWQGKVILRAHVTAEGTVKNATVQESSGFPVLDDSAVQAVKTWTFEPAKNGEFALASIVDLPILFDLLQ